MLHSRFFLDGLNPNDFLFNAAYRNAVREQKQAANISAAKRERDFYLSKVDQSKAIAAMEERKNKVTFSMKIL